MIVDRILARLDGVRASGHDRWVARCPAHPDRRPSLSVRAADTGAVLLYCHAGCAVADIAAALGIDLSDLFPPRPDNVVPLGANRPRVSALTPLVAAFEHDLLIVHVLLADVASGRAVDPQDRETAKQAALRIWTALQEARRVI